jgi:prepilin-type N-terminal cleavage/methylation domain-containing protein
VGRRSSDAGRRGFTLVELAIGITILAFGAGLVAYAASGASRVASAALLQSRLSEDGRRLTTELSADLRQSAPDLTVGDGDGSELRVGSTLSFRVATDFDETTGALEWSAQPVVYAFILEPAETANSLDDDGDGLVDEGSVVRDGRVLVTGVTRFQTSFVCGHDGETEGGLDGTDWVVAGGTGHTPTGVAVRFTLAGSSGGEVLRHDGFITITFRN